MQSGRGHTDERVARSNCSTVDQPIPSDHADNEAGDVVFTVGVESRHFSGFAAKKRTSVLTAGGGEPVDNLDCHIRLQPPGGEIIEKKQRLRTLHEDVVDTMV